MPPQRRRRRWSSRTPAAEAAREAKLRAEQRIALEGSRGARSTHARTRDPDTGPCSVRGTRTRPWRSRASWISSSHPQQQHFAAGADVTHGAAPLHGAARAARQRCSVARRIDRQAHGLTKPELRALTHAAAVHAVGLTRMPPHMHEEEPASTVRGTPLADYPSYSALILEQCGGFDAEVLRIVSEHRERPDGSGLPEGIAGRTHPSACADHRGGARTADPLRRECGGAGRGTGRHLQVAARVTWHDHRESPGECGAADSCGDLRAVVGWLGGACAETQRSGATVAGGGVLRSECGACAPARPSISRSGRICSSCARSIPRSCRRRCSIRCATWARIRHAPEPAKDLPTVDASPAAAAAAPAQASGA